VTSRPGMSEPHISLPARRCPGAHPALHREGQEGLAGKYAGRSRCRTTRSASQPSDSCSSHARRSLRSAKTPSRLAGGGRRDAQPGMRNGDRRTASVVGAVRGRPRSSVSPCVTAPETLPQPADAGLVEAPARVQADEPRSFRALELHSPTPRFLDRSNPSRAPSATGRVRHAGKLPGCLRQASAT